MHNLRIEGRKIFLDGFELKEVSGYELKENVGEAAEVTLRLKVQDVVVKPFQAAHGTICGVLTGSLTSLGHVGPHEVIAPLTKLEKMLEQHFSSDKSIRISGEELGMAAIKAIDEVTGKAGKPPFISREGLRMTINDAAELKVSETVIKLCDYIQESMKSKETDRIESLPLLITSLASLIRN